MQFIKTSLGWVLRLALILLVALAVLIAERLSWLPHSVAPLSGTADVPGITSPVEIRRDKNAVPHIYAGSARDVYFGLGFAHAQDRLWQMDLARRVMQGRTAELIGPLGIETDRAIRALNIAKSAADSYETLTPEAKAVLQSYAAGINAWIGARRAHLPIEFQLLYAGFEPWQPVHTLLIMKYFGLTLSGNWWREAQLARFRRSLSTQQLAELFPAYPPAQPVALDDAMRPFQHSRLDLPYKIFERVLGPKGASNNWVVDGRLTQSGKPLLANDAHLGLSAPGVFYLAHLELPEGSVAGATIPGIPTVILGRNEHLAWAFTTTHADTEDLVSETLDPTDPNFYLGPQGRLAFVQRSERIKVRFARDEIATFRTSRHGPVLPATREPLKSAQAEGTVFALAATTLSARDTTFEAALGLMTASSVAAATRAMAHYQTPMQNMLFADTSGSIALRTPARVPVRGPLAAPDGLTPADGKIQMQLWTGFVPYAELPQITDPPAGKIVTANNKIVPDDFPHLIAAEWNPGYRAERINALLGAGAPYAAADFNAMQMDVHAAEADALLPLLLTLPADGEREAKALALLRAWNRDMAADRPEPLIYTAWLHKLQRLITSDELGDLAGAGAPDPLFLISVLEPGGLSHWCDDQATEDRETCEEMLGRALHAALEGLTRAYGGDMAAWRWGAAHRAVHDHPLLGSLPLIGKLFSRTIEVPGGPYTVNVGTMPFSGREPYRTVHAATIRAVYDLADLDASQFIVAFGQSGNPLSPYYDNFLEAWAKGSSISIPTPKNPADLKETIGVWRLSPS